MLHKFSGTFWAIPDLARNGFSISRFLYLSYGNEFLREMGFCSFGSQVYLEENENWYIYVHNICGMMETSHCGTESAISKKGSLDFQRSYH